MQNIRDSVRTHDFLFPDRQVSTVGPSCSLFDCISICLSTLVEKCKSTHLKQQCSVRSNFLFVLLAKTQQVAMASAQRLQPDPCYGRLHFRFHGDLTSSQGFSYHLFQTQISSSNLFPAIKCIIIRPPAHLCRRLNCDTSRMNSASSLFTFSLSLSLKPLPF